MLDGKLAYGGMWFADTECRRILPGPGTIKGPNTRAFAECLASVTLSVGQRKSPILDVAVLTYEPGIEIEVLLGGTRERPTIRWIGYLSPHDGEPHPTISPDVLEMYRTAGSRDFASDHPTWIKLCTDVEGNVASHRVISTRSYEAQVAAVRHVAQWKFRPVFLDGVTSPICSVVLVGKPGTDGPSRLPFPTPPDYDGVTLVVPPNTLVARSMDKLITPDDAGKTALMEAGVHRLVASIQYCVDQTGRVDRVWMLKASKLASWNHEILRRAATWTFEPPVADKTPVRACSIATFIYNQQW
jgi:hypothetical protein